MKKLLLTLFSIGMIGVAQAQSLDYQSLSSSSKGAYTSYKTVEGFTIRIGDTLEIGTPFNGGRVYKYLQYINWGSLGVEPLAIGDLGAKYVVVKRLELGGNSKRGYTVGVTTKAIVGIFQIVGDLQKALDSGELLYRGMTSAKALAELQKLKQKLDLGIITQQQYDLGRAELIQYIK